MRFNISPLATVIVGAAAVAASNIGRAMPDGLSPECQAALVQVAASPDAACLDPTDLAALVATGPDQSFIPGINTWLVGICGIAPCTDANLAAIWNGILTGCPQETAGWNITVQDIQKVYPIARKIACLEDTRDSQLCITQTLYNIQNVTGILSPNNLQNVTDDLASGVTTIPNSVICSDCVKEAFNIVEQGLPDFLDPNTSSDLSTTCGPAFIDGNVPPTIVNSGVAGTRRRFGRFYI